MCSNIPVTGALIEATLSAVQNGTSVNYSYSDLVNAAQAAINKTYSTAYTYETVYSLSGVTQVAFTAAYGVGTSNASYNYPAWRLRLSLLQGKPQRHRHCKVHRYCDHPHCQYRRSQDLQRYV